MMFSMFLTREMSHDHDNSCKENEMILHHVYQNKQAHLVVMYIVHLLQKFDIVRRE